MAVSVGPNNLITDVPGIAVGQAEDHAIRTGTTVIIGADRLVAGVDVRGGGPGTRETDLMDSSCMVDAIDAISLSGGSAYGLDAGTGAVAELAAAGRGFAMNSTDRPIPLVPGAIIFDLANGGDKSWGPDDFPYVRLGREATRKALAQLDSDPADRRFDLGNHGAGLGAIAGAFKGGVGSASAILSDGPTVGALMIANPIGSPVIPGSQTLWAGLLEQDDEMGGQARDLSALSPGAGLPDETKMGPGIDDLLGSLQAPDNAQPGANHLHRRCRNRCGPDAFPGKADRDHGARRSDPCRQTNSYADGWRYHLCFIDRSAWPDTRHGSAATGAAGDRSRRTASPGPWGERFGKQKALAIRKAIARPSAFSVKEAAPKKSPARNCSGPGLNSNIQSAFSERKDALPRW